LSASESQRRRWNVITSGLLIAALALVVMFTNRANFLSPIAVIVVAAVGAVALMLQLRFRYREVTTHVHVPLWLNVLGVVFALSALFGEPLHLHGQTVEVIALLAVFCFAISGAFILHELRKQRAVPK
jgi:drug/metabolite transporter (DMT)-like permease